MKVRGHSPLWRRIVRTIGRQLFRLAENNDDPRPTHNGELRWLRHLLRRHTAAHPARPFLAIDGGANRGDYTRLLLNEARAAGCPIVVHAFEPSATCVTHLRATFAEQPAVHVTAAALGETAGESPLWADAPGSSQASLVVRPGFAGERSMTSVRVLPLADHLNACGITAVDLLKLDVEGSELAALHGLGAMLRPEFVAVIQFEYGGTTLDAGRRLRDFYALLEPRGYVLAKLLPHGVAARSYRPWMENFQYANYLALAPHWLDVKLP